MLDLAEYCLWAVRMGLFGSFFITIVKHETSKIDSHSPAFVTFIIFAATFLPSKYYNLFKRYAPLMLQNTTRVLIFFFIAFAAAVLGILINEQILPAFARLLQHPENPELPSTWAIVSLVFLIVPNIKLLYHIIRTHIIPWM